MDRKTIQEQFGAYANHYVNSRTHARGASLTRLLELIEAQPGWQMLDIATGAGHTALAFAPYVGHVWATDITPEMLANTRQLAQERGLDNVTIEHADAEALPYEDESFDLVTCRIAAHHFGEVAPFLKQAKRVLRPGGTLAVADNILPEGLAGDYVNAFEKLRDPSHARCLSLEEWLAAYQDAGLVVQHYETLDMQLVFEEWARRHDATMQRFLRALLAGAPPEAAAFLQPQTINNRTTFRLQTGIVIGQRPL